MNSEKTKQVGARLDEPTFLMLEKATEVSGVPFSEIIRRGVRRAANEILDLYSARLNKPSEFKTAA